MLIYIKNKMMTAIFKGLEEAKKIGGVPEHIAVSTKEAAQLIKELNECKDFQKTNHKIKIESEHGFDPRFLLFGANLTEDKITQFVTQLTEKHYTLYIDQVPILIDNVKSERKSGIASKNTKITN